MNQNGYNNPKDISNGIFKKGDTVTFTRQAVGYPTKKLKGKIVGFNYTTNLDVTRRYYPVAHVKVDCEYGSALEYNHTLHLRELKLV